MPWIEHPDPEEALTDFGRETLREALVRNHGVMGMYAAMYTFPQGADHMAQATDIMHFGETALPRVYKEMIATVVSSANGCQY